MSWQMQIISVMRFSWFITVQLRAGVNAHAPLEQSLTVALLVQPVLSTPFKSYRSCVSKYLATNTSSLSCGQQIEVSMGASYM
jgi:hypothetical protein